LLGPAGRIILGAEDDGVGLGPYVLAVGLPLEQALRGRILKNGLVNRGEGERVAGGWLGNTSRSVEKMALSEPMLTGWPSGVEGPDDFLQVGARHDARIVGNDQCRPLVGLNSTRICMSRRTDPTAWYPLVVLRHSSTMKAMLYSA
jgi:hypothetical protein